MRSKALSDIADREFDVIVIGAGINGAGIAREAARRNLRVLLLDKGDIAGGTSAWSTRLIHGGLRYLEHGELKLVRESLRERERLLSAAPHLVRPLPMLVPVYAGGRRSLSAIRAGMLAYDLLSFDKSLGRHRMLSRAETLRRAPGLSAKGLRGAALYFDAQVEYAERLVLENVLSAREWGASVLTYARVERGLVEGGAMRGVAFVDLIDGGRRPQHQAFASVVLNVAGPWVDEVVAQVPCPAAARLVGGTKGSHLVVANFPGAPREALYAEAATDRRPFFIIPWNKLYLVGTTDTRYAGDLDQVMANEDEIEYLLRETNHLIPASGLTRDSVLYTYSGVRPLAFQADGAAGGITRRHFLHDHAPALEGFVSVVGGKLTTYRSLAEQAIDLVCKKLRRRVLTIDSTAFDNLPGAPPRGSDMAEFGAHFAADSPLPAATNARLLRVYGVRAAEVLDVCREHSRLCEPLVAGGEAVAAEVIFSFRHEIAETLTDCLLRRTMLSLNSACGLDVVEPAACVAQEFLGWDQQRADREINKYRRHVRRFHPRAFSAQNNPDPA